MSNANANEKAAAQIVNAFDDHQTIEAEIIDDPFDAVGFRVWKRRMDAKVVGAVKNGGEVHFDNHDCQPCETASAPDAIKWLLDK